MEENMATAAPRAMADTAHTKLTHDLIESDRVEGTNVYRSDGTKIGSVERLMIDKYSGQVAYAVMSFGGFLGLGEDHYPVPWQKLTYNERLGGYELNISDGELKKAPKYATGESARSRIDTSQSSLDGLFDTEADEFLD
jgi:sporulation protein YlmC with PRC-barrel domain